MKKIAILIPCYNEELTIKKVIKDFKKQIPEVDIYVYDNNSKDKTAQIAEDNGAIVRSEPRQGKGNVIRSMFRDIDADCYVMVDGDDTYPAESVHQLIEPVISEKVDMVIGDRLSNGTYKNENKRIFHNFGNNIVKNLINKLFKSNVNDIMTGYRAFSRDFVKSIPVLKQGFEIETEMTIYALDKRFKILEIPIEYRDRPKGSFSKLNTVKDGFKVLKTIFTLYKDCHPLPFFSFISLILFIIGSIIGFSFNNADNVVLITTSILILILAFFFFICGIILNAIVKGRKQEFEITLNKIRMIGSKGN